MAYYFPGRYGLHKPQPIRDEYLWRHYGRFISLLDTAALVGNGAPLAVLLLSLKRNVAKGLVKAIDNRILWGESQ